MARDYEIQTIGGLASPCRFLRRNTYRAYGLYPEVVPLGVQEWIHTRMRELESKEGVYSLEGGGLFHEDYSPLDQGAFKSLEAFKMQAEMITRGVG